MYQTVTRIRFHSTRFSTGVLIASFILAALSVIMATSFPTDEEFISEYLGIISEAGLDALFSTVNTDAPGWLFWLSLMMGVYIYYIFAVVGVRIGSGIFPTRDEDALELLAASNPQSKRKMYVETYLSGMIVLALLVLVSYGSLIIYSLLNDAADLIGRLGIIHLFYYLIAICMMSFASMMTVIRFSKSSGQKWGYGYLIFAFMLELGGSSPDMSPEALYMSVNSYLSPMEGLFTEKWNWEGFAVIAAITTFMFLVSLWRIKKPEYIERIKASKAKSRFGFLPKFSAEGKVARKYPVFFEELRVDRSLLITWLSFVLFFICYVVYLYATVYGDDPNSLNEMMAGFDMPIMDAFTHGHPIGDGYLGFLGFEYYGLFWLYYGLFAMFPAIGAASRDHKLGTSDLVWANSVTPAQVMRARTLAILTQVMILFSLTTGFLFVMQSAMGLEVDSAVQLHVYLVGLVYYPGLVLLLQGVAMSFRIDRGRKYGLYLFLAAILLLIMGFMNADVEFVRYLSILYYFDAVGLVYGQVELGVSLLRVGIFTAVSALIYLVGLQRYIRTNLS